MKVLEARSRFLTNHEVALHIQDLVRFQDSHLKHEGLYTSALESDNLRTVQYELQGYLDNLPVMQVSQESIRAFCTELLDFNPSPPSDEEDAEPFDTSLTALTKGEKLMCINTVPSNVAELSAIIEEFTDRFKSEWQQLALCDCIERHFGKRPPLEQTSEATASQGPGAATSATISAEAEESDVDMQQDEDEELVHNQTEDYDDAGVQNDDDEA